MSTRTAILVPTHDHAATLPTAIASALAQTDGDFDIHIVGDGVGDDTRAVVRALMAEDHRIRFHDQPKGPRLGEASRHPLLLSLDVEIVTYLCDDDLLTPDHLAVTVELLRDADLAHPPPILMNAHGSLSYLPIDIGRPDYRAMMLGGTNRVPLTGAAHTMTAYRRLPHGWRTTPPDVATDLYMWQQFLAQPWCRAVTGTRATAISLPSPYRVDRTSADRGAEIAELWRRMADPAGAAEFDARVAAACREEAIHKDATLRHIQGLRWWRLRVAVAKRLRSLRRVRALLASGRHGQPRGAGH